MLDFPTTSLVSISSRPCGAECFSTAAMLSNRGKCSALLTREGFFDFVLFKVNCNVSHQVALVCQHKRNTDILYNNNTSDIRVSANDGFYSLQIYSSCDVGWFKVGNLCINIFRCLHCINNTVAQSQCLKYRSKLAHQILHDVTTIAPGYTLHNNTELSFFWSMFHHVRDLDPLPESKHSMRVKDITRKIAMNITALCSSQDLHDLCKDNNIALSVTSRYRYFIADRYLRHSGPWSLIFQPSFQKTKYRHYALCEKPVIHVEKPTNCSHLYLTCSDGTCVHDSLVCDGQPHCPFAEDETDCQHICSDHTINCKSNCRHRDLCSCSPEYFQCLSGGCVPLKKLCDKTVHCGDASDEPPTCVYIKPEQFGHSSVSLDVNHHVNNLIKVNKYMQQKCFQTEVVSVNNVDYKMSAHQPICSPSSHTHDIKVLCTGVNTYYTGSPRSFSLDYLCIYDLDCDQAYVNHCANGFHLLKCEHMYCVGRFKCPSSYCISFDHICNKVCDCLHCEDESICDLLSCPGMVLMEQVGSGLKCSQSVTSLKHGMNMRQLIRSKDRNHTDNFPILVYLEGVENITALILTPEIVTYCQISFSDLDVTDDTVLSHMVSVRRLLLSNNNIQKIHDFMFATMSQLIVLDLSYNLIQHLPSYILCTLHNLGYISLKYNLISKLQIDVFVKNYNLQVLLLESNDFSSQSVIADAYLSSLYRLTSDIPRLCCIFEAVTFCSPPFPLFVSCSNMITSKVQIVLGWLIGVSTCFLNVCCVVLIVYKQLSTASKSVSIVILFSVNLCFAEVITSFCLLSYPVINAVFQDIFGVIADQWRHSWTCVGLESLFSLSSRASMAFAVCLSVHFAIHIPSMTRREAHPKVTIWQIVITWFIIASMCIAVQILEHIYNTDPFNYLCFPFTTSVPADPWILSLHIIMVTFDCLLVLVCIISYGYLLVFTIRQTKSKTLQSVSKRQKNLQKFAVRMAVLILSMAFTWIPILLIQVLVLLHVTIMPSIYLWCVLVTFPTNMIIDPILLIRNTAV